MKKGLLILIVFTAIFSPVFAKHITGGEMIYDYIGPGSTANSKRYTVTLRLFRDDNCVSCANMPGSVTIGVFNNDNNAAFGGYLDVPRTSTESLPLNSLPPCIVNPPILMYTAGYYVFEVDLPENDKGYTLTYQTCCRIDAIENIPDGVGATYITVIPGKNSLDITDRDNSPRFSLGISVVCYNKPFTLDFSAVDPDNEDVLVYSLCDAYNGGGARLSDYTTPAAPDYISVNYINGFSSSQPLGPLASINPNTGIITGISPNSGKYVVSVCVASYRRGKLIASHRKDFIISVAACDLPGAKLVTPYYINCDSYLVNFTNLIESPLNLTFDWSFGDPGSGANNTSALPAPGHNFSDTGIYFVKLVVNKGSACADSAIAPVRIFPGFFPAFKQTSPMCKGFPVQFTDITTATFSSPSNWKWDFGDPSVGTDVSTIKNPTYTYAASGKYVATLIVSTNKGCIDTLTNDVDIVDKPPFDVGNDTLICIIDTLQLIAKAGIPGGNVTWSPNYNINNINSFTPLVSPDVTTVYHVQFKDNFGCVANDSVKVNVVNDVSLQAANDTSICRTDNVALQLKTDALYFTWTPAATLNKSTIQNPVALPTAALTTYHVVASISKKCFKADDIIVKTVPYPIPNAGADTSICFGKSVTLNASGGSIYSWRPTAFLNDPNIANPIAQNPTARITYIVTVKDTLGCPKPKTDTMIVTVIIIHADAGPRDTSVVQDQPLQLNATGSINYLWSPATWLSSTTIFNPVSLPQGNIEYALRVSDAQGCFGLDTINVRFYKVQPDLYVPSAFTPDGDGTNDIFRPIALGIKSLEVFSVYNRWGQVVYTTSQIGQGWDGKLKGAGQPTGTFVWYAEATDYRGKKIKRKGSVILIR